LGPLKRILDSVNIKCQQEIRTEKLPKQIMTSQKKGSKSSLRWDENLLVTRNTQNLWNPYTNHGIGTDK
jgi:hypothetical protein